MNIDDRNTDFDMHSNRSAFEHPRYISGTDVIGSGLKLGDGYTATATIQNAWSDTDTDPSGVPTTPLRGAEIVEQPSAYSFATSVAWYADSGESINDTNRWDFTGPAGRRVVSSMPLQRPCDS